MKKKSIRREIVHVTGIAHKGTAVGRTAEGLVVFVDHAIPGDQVEVILTKKRKGVWQGKTETILMPSPHRVEPVCAHFGICGGCSWQHLNYPEQLNQKQTVVYDALTRIAKIDQALFEPILGASQTEFYRNKLEFTFSNKRWLTEEELHTELAASDKLALGFHRPGNFNKVVDIQKCYLQSDRSNDIRNFIKDFAVQQEWDFYNIHEQKGYLRNLIIRSNSQNNIMCILVTAFDDHEKLDALLEVLPKKFPEIVSFYKVINPKRNDSLFDLNFVKVFGQDYLTEQMDHVNFLIGPKSFFQTNTSQATELYRIVKDFCSLKGTETVYDWYCGVGSIGIYLANSARQIVGVDEIGEAIEDARLNADANQLLNCQFFHSDAKDISIENLVASFGKPDVVIVDPPRAGLHEKVIEHLKQLKPETLVYVSCNPGTQARDLALLKENYQVIKIKPVDLFPHTNHIESVALLSLHK
ncbi:MAG: 23S rRNA (uracil(1939)-C(5))-methyltransferase RlmD [Saprospiraceae bacterium]|jgi:23S rRNA (uracil1939-C5)-methyltransferase